MLTSREVSQDLAAELEIQNFWLTMKQIQPVLGNRTHSEVIWAV